MAARDIMPWISPDGGTRQVRWNGMTASEVFEIGEPIVVQDAGTVAEFVGATTSVPITEFDSGMLGGIDAAGPGAGNIDPKTGAAYATGGEIPWWPFGDDTLFITKNFFATGDTTTLAVPAVTDIGESYKMNQAAANTAWGLEQTAAVPGTDLQCVVHDVLDAEKRPVRVSGATGVYLVFEALRPTLAENN